MESSMQKFLNNTMVAIFGPALIGIVATTLMVMGFGDYGWSLFLGLPLLVSFLSAFAWCFKRKKTFGSAYGISTLSILALGGLILCFALDGLICLLMALPLAFILGLFGVCLGRIVGSSVGKTPGVTIPCLLCICFPLLAGFEHVAGPAPGLREVRTSVRVDASLAEVWQMVVAFPEMTEPPHGIFRLGIAYPIKARMEGSGVGAMRYCTFSTGDFVEPITVWDAPNRLSFDVTQNPSPMRELSPYADLDVPHLHGHMVSKKGQFRLTEEDGGVLLEGTTWYTHTLSPQWYWGILSDQIIHRIHLRVLYHIKHEAEH
jgi:hypothetical protein